MAEVTEGNSKFIMVAINVLCPSYNEIATAIELMSTILLKAEAIEAQLASYLCPRGTTGRLHTLRLRRRFQPARQRYSVAFGSTEDSITSYGVILHEASDLALRREQHQIPQDAREQPSRPRIPAESNRASKSNISTTEDIRGISGSSVGLEHPRRLRSSHHLAKANHGDTLGLPFPGRRYNLQHRDLNGENLLQALQSDNPHAIFSALLRVTLVGHDGYRGHEIFNSLSSNCFSEILRCLDPEHFVTRYVDLHKHISPQMPRYRALQPQREHGLHQFSINFMARIRVIVASRRSRGFNLSLSDYKCLLRCAGAVENPRASQALWLAMRRDAIEPDTECYNYYLSGILGVGVSDGTQRSNLRIPPDMPQTRPEGPSQEFRDYYNRLGVNVKHESSKIFSDMLQQGIVGDERTFCLLMISLARVGDMQGVKAILSRVWGINVDDLATKDESGLRDPKFFTLDSPFRPSKTLLFALAHSFGINNAVPVALRLIDYVSRNYSIVIPTEVWEDLLGLTFALSKPRVSRKKVKDMGLSFLPVDTVSSLWEVLTSQPYSIKPTMAMYDRLIVSLLRRQRFGEARERMGEALKLHIKSVYKYGERVATEELQSPIFEAERGSERLDLVRGSRAYQNYLELKRDKTFEYLSQNRSRQYLYRWCRIFIDLATRSLIDNPAFAVVDLPRFVYDYKLFVPRLVEYPIATGFISFASGSAQLSKWLAQEKAAHKWSSPRTKLDRRATPPTPALVENDDCDYDGDMPLDARLDLEELFGKS